MTAFQAIFTAILQGITELFPVSSLGHAVVLPALLGWQIDQHSPSFLPFLVVLHLGTAAALLIYFWRDWIQLLLAVLGRPTERPRSAELRLLVLIIIATIPAAIVGFALNKFLRGLFGVPSVAAFFLIVNGFVLFAGERLKRRASGASTELAALDWRGALMIGLGFITRIRRASPSSSRRRSSSAPRCSKCPSCCITTGRPAAASPGLPFSPDSSPESPPISASPS